MFQSLYIIQSQYIPQRKQIPIKQKQLNNVANNYTRLEDSPTRQREGYPKENQQAIGINFRIFNQKFAQNIQKKPQIKVIIISYVICTFFNLLNAQSLYKHRNEDLIQEINLQNNEIEQYKYSANEENINTIIFQFLAQDYFIYTAVRLLFHDKLLRKIEIKDLILSFWLLYITCSFSLLVILIFFQSIWQNMLVFTVFNTYLMYQYRTEQKLIKNFFKISQNVEQIIRSARRQIGGENGIDEDGQEEVNEDHHQQRNQNNGDDYESDEHEEQQEAVRLNTRRSRGTGPRGNTLVRELVQQFIGEFYERNQVCQLIQVGISKWLVIYKFNHTKYASIYINQGKTKLMTQKIDSNCIVLKYYWDEIITHKNSLQNINQTDNNKYDKKKYVNIGVMYNIFTGKLMLFTINIKGIKYLQTLDIGVVNKEHIILHEQSAKFVSLRLQEIVFRNLIKNEMSSQTLADYTNRKLKLYYSIEKTDYVICTSQETLIISSIDSTIEWKQHSMGNDWEIELMNSALSSNNSEQNNMSRKFSYYDKKQYLILGKTKTHNFPTSIKNINILNRRHLFIQDESSFYVYSIPTQQILHTLPNKYVEGYQIMPIHQTVNSPNLSIDQFLKIQNCIQKIIADALSKFLPNSNTAITNEDPAAIYHQQYTSIPITFLNPKNNQTTSSPNNPSLFFIYPKQIQQQNTSPLFTENLFQVQEKSLQNILSQVDEKKQ